jgi:hypothetical protein
MGEDYGCTLQDKEVRCWGSHGKKNDDYHQTTTPRFLKNPRAVSIGEEHTCALDEAGKVVCWGTEFFSGLHLFPPANLYLESISAGNYHTCGIRDHSVICWGDKTDGAAYPPYGRLKNPRVVAAGSSHTCALDDTGVQCWGSNDRGQTKVPQDISNPRLLSVATDNSCVIDDSGVKCWGDDDWGKLKVPTDLVNPRAIAVARDHVCVLDDSGVRCWGENDFGQITVPSDLQHPRFVAASKGRTCALDDSGMRCWGKWDNGTQNSIRRSKPEFFLPHWADDMRGYTYGEKTVFLDSLQQEVLNSISGKGFSSAEQQLVVFLANGWMQAMTPEVFLRRLTPEWNFHFRRLRDLSGVKSANDIAQTTETLRVAVKMLHVALSSIKAVVPIERQKDIEAVVADIGATLANTEITAVEAKGLMKSYESHRELVTTISGSERLAPTAAVLRDLAAWIKR